MKIRINFFAEPPEPNVKPSVIACPTGDFASLEEARPIALADGNKPAINLGYSDLPVAKATPPYGGSPGARPVIAPGLDRAGLYLSAVVGWINSSAPG